MKFSRLNAGTVVAITGLALVLVYQIPGQAADAHLRHGLRVFIDPDTGQFQRPARLPESAPPNNALLAAARKLLGAPAHKEVSSLHAHGGYRVDLKDYYRPPRRHDRHSGS